MNQLTSDSKNHTDRVQRFVALRPGQFWKAKKTDQDRHIVTGEALMLAGVDSVDDKPHTIRVRLHPSKITAWDKEAKYLVDDFMSAFDWISEEEAQAIRDAEIKAIQNRLSAEQDNINTACSDTAELDRMIEQEATAEEESTNLPIKHQPMAPAVVGAIQTQKVMSLMQSGLNTASIEEIKQSMEAQRDIVVKRSEWIKSRTVLLSEIAGEMTPFFEEKAAVALAQSKDMRDHIDNLMKGIGNLNLYVLKNVAVETLKQGKSAVSTEKLTLAQKVLYMDEELAVYEDIDDQFDANDREAFFKAVSKHQALVDQIFPSARCVVAVATTRKLHNYRERGYGAMEAAALTRENQLRFLLVRDGDNIHLVLSPEMWHQYANTLFPTASESNAPFKGFDGRDITYRDLEFTNALEKHEIIALGYKRMLILLCGLDHNRSLFGDFYPGEPSLEFMSEAFQEQYFRFIYDADGRGMLPSHCPESISEWAESMNKEIGPGSRVIMRCAKLFSYRSIPGCYERESDYNSRSGRTPDIQYQPSEADKNGFIEGHITRHQGDMSMEIPVAGRTYQGKEREFNARLNITEAITTAEDFDYLCVDRLNPDDARFYLNHRPSRTLNVAGIRMLKRAIGMAEQDRTHEKPLRDALLEALMGGDIETDNNAAIRLIDDGIAKYKCAHPRKDVVRLLNDKKAYNALCDQLYQLAGKGREVIEEIKKKEETIGRTVIRITILSNGQHCAYSTPLPAEIDDRLIPFAWIARTRYRTTERSVRAMKNTFVLAGKVINSETTIYESKEHKTDAKSSDGTFTTPTAKAKFLDGISAAGAFDLTEEILAPQKDRESIKKLFKKYAAQRKLATYGSKVVYEPWIQIPFGAIIDKWGKLLKIGLACEAWAYIAWLVAHDEEMVKELKDIHADIYASKQNAKDRIRSTAMESKGKQLYEIMKLRMFNRKAEVDMFEKYYPGRYLSRDEYKGYSYNASIEKIVNDEGCAVYIGPKIGDDIDRWLNIKKPDGFKPFFYSDSGIGKKSELDIFECNDASIAEFDGGMSVADSWDKIVNLFETKEHTHCIDSKSYDITCKWVQVEPRELRGITAYKSFDYKEISRVERNAD